MNVFNSKREYRYDLIRILLTALVVIGHANYYNAGNSYGGIHILDKMTCLGIADTKTHMIINYIAIIIYTFHMPAFFALSGELFAIQIKKGKFQTFGELVFNKINRLIIPFIIIYFMWNTPIKVMAGYYRNTTNIIRDIMMQIVDPTNMYLWYLEALFFVFILAYLLIKVFPIRWWIQNTVSVIIYLAIQFYGRFFSDNIIFGNPLKYLIWFVLGMNMCEIVKCIKCKISILYSGYGMLILIVSYIIGYFGLDYLPHLVWLAKGLYLPFISIIFIWVLCDLVSQNLSRNGRKNVEYIASYSYGVYLYAEPLNYLLIVFVEKFIGLKFYGIEFGAIAIFFIRIIGTTAIAVVIVKILKKMNLKICLF